MRDLSELGRFIAYRRKELGLRQGLVAHQAGITQELLSRFENGRVNELGARKLLAILAVLDLDLALVPRHQAGTLDELRKERGQ